jgi:D-alanyl-D-alanine carboxypeptidase/D-alanyl-D-alanine-endopeptidase (penicillin-binding protein 4)
LKTLALCLTLAVLPGAATAQTAAPKSFPEALAAVMARPEFRHASFGVEIWSLDTQTPVFALNAEKLFTPGSTTKLLTEGTALRLLGADYHFKTPVYRTGEIGPGGVLAGDLVLVASGDPNLSNRLQPDGSLAFADEDHTYGGPQSRLVPGDPLTVIREFAKKIAAAGIKRVTGRVLVDVSLFSEADRELGTGVQISPIAVNDNVVDLVIKPGASVGAPADIAISPRLPYLHFENRTTTTTGAGLEFGGAQTHDNPDGSETVVLSGSIGQGSGPVIYGYPVSSPSRFAGEALTLALKEEGVAVDGAPGVIKDPTQAATWRQPADLVAEHVSAPLAEEIKVTLKVSHNLHASMTPFILGAVLGKATTGIDAKGFALEADMLRKAGLDLSGASQSDGAGGAAAAFYTPDFMVHYLAFMAGQPDFPIFKHALPVLGRDGTLVDIQKTAPGAGHVFAKTGTFVAMDLLNAKAMLVGKGLAGYTTTPSGARYAFALYINHLELKDERPASELAGQALGEIASAAYALPIDRSSLPEVGR